MKEFVKNKKLIKQILFTLLILAVYRFGCVLTISGIDTQAASSMMNENIFGIMNMLGGGALSKMSVFALGVSPYITAGIVIQLLSMDVIPYLKEQTQNGQVGRLKLEKITRDLAAVIAFFQALSIIYGLDSQYGIFRNGGSFDYFYTAMIMATGSMILVWLGDRITAHGIGNGISVLICAGVVSNIPSNLIQTWKILTGEATSGQLVNGVGIFVMCIALYILIILGVVIMDLATRRIPIQYPSSSAQSSAMNFIPFKINSSGVIPVIFASSVMSFVQLVVGLINKEAGVKVNGWLYLGRPLGLCIYVVLIVYFAYFYTMELMNPDDIAGRLSRQQAFIPGIRPGEETKIYLKKVLYRVTFFGTLMLIVIAVLPYVLPMYTSIPASMSLGGTGIIVVVGVAMEILNAIRTEMEVKNYSNYSAGWKRMTSKI